MTFFVLYDSIKNSVFSSQVLQLIKKKIKAKKHEPKKAKVKKPKKIKKIKTTTIYQEKPIFSADQMSSGVNEEIPMMMK